MAVWRALEGAGLPVRDGALQYVPLAPADMAEADLEGNERLLEALLGVEDVDAVYTTCVGLEGH